VSQLRDLLQWLNIGSRDRNGDFIEISLESFTEIFGIELCACVALFHVTTTAVPVLFFTSVP